MNVPRVRYLTIPRSSLEIVTTLSDEEKANYIDVVFDCFVQLESGEKPDFQPTESRILNMAIRDSVIEVENGFQTYMKRVTARANHKEFKDQSMIDHRLIFDRQQREEIERREEIEKTRDISLNHQVIDDVQRREIEARLHELGIPEADDGFWKTATKYGFDRVDDALNRAESVGIDSLKRITGMIKEGV